VVVLFAVWRLQYYGNILVACVCNFITGFIHISFVCLLLEGDEMDAHRADGSGPVSSVLAGPLIVKKFLLFKSSHFVY